jgi:hypothetical protein
MLVWREAIPANTAVTPLTTMLDQPTPGASSICRASKRLSIIALWE